MEAKAQLYIARIQHKIAKMEHNASCLSILDLPSQSRASTSSLSRHLQQHLHPSLRTPEQSLMTSFGSLVKEAEAHVVVGTLLFLLLLLLGGSSGGGTGRRVGSGSRGGSGERLGVGEVLLELMISFVLATTREYYRESIGSDEKCGILVQRRCPR